MTPHDICILPSWPKQMRILGIALLAGTMLISPAGAMHDKARHGKVLSPLDAVKNFDDLVLAHKPREAIDTYVASDFIEHDPEVAGGTKEGLYTYMTKHGWDPNGNSKMRDIIDRTIAQGDFVIVEHHIFENDKDPGTVFVDTFRFKDGQMKEHWDVAQPMPAKPSGNPNSMY